jgi:hypothetical protein
LPEERGDVKAENGDRQPPIANEAILTADDTVGLLLWDNHRKSSSG